MKLYALAAVFILLVSTGAAQGTDEIVIEIAGNSFAQPAAPDLWDYDALQLTRRLRGQTREQVLYAVPVVSDKDRIIHGNGAEYALVEYYSGGKFRKFLFKAESPQTFITAAATAQDVLAVNKKYGINIGLTQQAFETAYPQAVSEGNDLLPQDTALYKLPYKDLNTPQAVNRWFLFENEELTRTFENESDKNTFLEKLKKQAKEKNETQRLVQQQSAQSQPRTVRKALISGGTAWDRANLPRVVNPKPLLRRQTQPEGKK